MADGKGFQVIVKINLPPEEQYHSGHSLIVQGDNPLEVEGLLGRLIAGAESVDKNTADQARFILARFIEFAQQGAVQSSLAASQVSSAGAEQHASPQDGAASGAVAPTGASGPSPAEDLASPALLKVVAKKTNTPLEELEGYTTEAAKALLKGGK